MLEPKEGYCAELLKKGLTSEGLLCLLELYSLRDRDSVIELITNYLLSEGYESQSVAELYLKFADDLKALGDVRLAMNVLKKARELDSSNIEIAKKIQILSSLSGALERFKGLINKGRIDISELEKAIKMATESQRSLEYTLEKHFGIPKHEIGEALSQFYKCPFLAYDPNIKLPLEIIRNLKKSFLIHEHWVPISWGADGVKVLIDDPFDLKRTGGIKGLLRSPKITFLVGIREDIEGFIEKTFEEINITRSGTLDQMVKSLENLPDITLEEEEGEQISFVDESNSQVVKLVDQIILLAYKERASDIHIEPSTVTKRVHVRFRIDGVLKEITQVPLALAGGMISRLKIMSNLDISEKRLPQDGKIVFRRKGIPEFELRLATIPIVGGLEDAVLRILAKGGSMRLEEMGLTLENLLTLREIIAQPYGLILVVGPTGSGKTTTLHAI
ncbi:MAG: GspE/PulE family protein, partial [Desulfatiglandales bacterium]